MTQGGVRRFEDLIAWRKARDLTRAIYRATRVQPFASDFALTNQVRRASVSIMGNIAEGFDRAGQAEFHRFLVIAKGSCAEVRSHLYVAFDAGYIPEPQFSDLLARTQELSRLLGGLRAAVKRH